jgi:hypothetical protein
VSLACWVNCATTVENADVNASSGVGEPETLAGDGVACAADWVSRTIAVSAAAVSTTFASKVGVAVSALNWHAPSATARMIRLSLIKIDLKFMVTPLKLWDKLTVCPAIGDFHSSTANLQTIANAW